MRTFRILSLAALIVMIAAAQTNTASLDGLVKDPQGALVANADVTVVHIQTNLALHTKSDDRGHWVIPALGTGTYRIAVTAAGFKKATVDNVQMDAGVPATVNLTLELGSVTETVEVTGGAEVLQTSSATVTTTLSGKQIQDLPIVSRNATDLIVVQPGAQTPAGPRNTTFNGLPQSTVNMTYDGINIQDNLLKNSSGGAFYPIVYPRLDAIEEVSVTTAAAGAESLAEGAVQVKFVTKQGTNQFHGGAFIQERNTFLNANYYFNNINGLPRDRILLHQIGANVGGPIKRNRVFFFFNYEVFRFPQSWTVTRTVLTDGARNGIFTYKDTTGVLRQTNLYSIAGARNFPNTPDPIIGATLARINQLAVPGNGVLRDQTTANEFNRNTFQFQVPGSHKIDFPRVRLDANLTSKHQIQAIFNIDPYRLFPDGINSNFPIFPQSGSVLNSNYVAGQREEFFTGVTALRSVWTSHLTGEVRFGLAGGNVLFSDGITPAMFSQWRGFGTNYPLVTSPFGVINPSRRNDPVKQTSTSFNWLRGSHVVNFGGSFSNIREWLLNTGTYITPQISFGTVTNDPVITGSTNIFDATNFPNISPTDRSNAQALYALLTGRVSSISRSLALDEQTKTYGNVPQIQRFKQWEYGLYIQDTWKIHPRVTLNYGVRFENQNPFQILNGVYTRVGYAGLFGVSGVNNLFKPGTLTGSVPSYTPVPSSDTTGYPPTRMLSPTLGVAWVLPDVKGPLGILTGRSGQSVLRVGFSSTTTRGESSAGISGVWGSNQGRTITTNVDPTNNPADFGAPGSVLFRNATLPVRSGVSTTPTYPIPANPGSSMNDYDPDLKARVVQSWNISFQRTLRKDTVLEVRYVGNRSERLWTSVNLNEVNIVESGFLDEFRNAQNNLLIARQVNPATNNFSNAGLAGQKAIPIIATALGSSNLADVTTATLLTQGQAGVLASNIAFTASRMTNLTNAGYPVNLFVVNPSIGNGGSNLTKNLGGTSYNGLQVELRRRMSAGLLTQASYTWSHALSTGNLLTLRDLDGIIVPSNFDIRHSAKVNFIYELPVGNGKTFLGSVSNRVVKNVISGWQIAGVSRIQSGYPTQLVGGRGTFNTRDAGVVLYNMTQKDLQDMMSIRKTTAQLANGTFQGQVYWLPQAIIDNSIAAFDLLPGKTVDKSKPYLGPPTTPGQFGNQVFVYGPWFNHWDLSLAKRTRIREGHEIEFRAQALNAFNLTNFFLANNGNSLSVSSANFGRTTTAYQDINSTNDPGGRMLEFVLRYRF